MGVSKIGSSNVWPYPLLTSTCATTSVRAHRIDNAKMLPLVEHGEGNQHRKAKLSSQLLEVLRKWCQIAQSQY